MWVLSKKYPLAKGFFWQFWDPKVHQNRFLKTSELTMYVTIQDRNQRCLTHDDVNKREKTQVLIKEGLFVPQE